MLRCIMKKNKNNWLLGLISLPGLTFYFDAYATCDYCGSLHPPTNLTERCMKQSRGRRSWRRRMSELDVGRQCSLSSCKQLDFLPFTCDYCGHVFCLAHRKKDDHGCTERHPVPERENRVAAAVRVACLKGSRCYNLFKNVKQQSEKNLHVSSAELPKELYSCSVKSCCQKVAICITCTHCQRQLCLRHRHHSDHDCVHLHQAHGRSAPRGGVVVPDGRVKKSSIIQVKDAKSGRRGAQNPQVAAKVALMRVKQRAVGSKSIPQEERFYLNVHMALDGRNDQLPAFVSKYWTVGKVLDSVITAAKVHSDNHLLGAQKVRLCDLHSRQPWPLEQRLEKFILGKTPLADLMEVLLIREGELEENDLLAQ